jgi:hypothetical protein
LFFDEQWLLCQKLLPRHDETPLVTDISRYGGGAERKACFICHTVPDIPLPEVALTRLLAGAFCRLQESGFMTAPQTGREQRGTLHF